MKIHEFKRAVNALGQISPDDHAVVVSILRKNGQIVTTNVGEASARAKIYETLKVLPHGNIIGCVTSTQRGGWDEALA